MALGRERLLPRQTKKPDSAFYRGRLPGVFGPVVRCTLPDFKGDTFRIIDYTRPIDIRIVKTTLRIGAAIRNGPLS